MLQHINTTNWPAVATEYKEGVYSKSEICRRHRLSRQKMEHYMVCKGILYGGLAERIQREVELRAPLALLSDEDIVSRAADRSVAVIKSHLTMTRALSARMLGLIENYDTMAVEVKRVLDDEQNAVQSVKSLLVMTSLFDGITRIAERLAKMEINTFAIGSDKPTTPSDADDEEPVRLELPDDPVSASVEYLRLMKG